MMIVYRMDGYKNDFGMARMIENMFSSHVAFLTLEKDNERVTICGKCDSKTTRDKIIQLVLNVQGVSSVDAAGLLA